MPLERAVLALVARKQVDLMPDTFRRFWCRVAGHSYIALPEFEWRRRGRTLLPALQAVEGCGMKVITRMEQPK